MQNTPVAKPVLRSKLRQKLGKEYFILRRNLRWKMNTSAYAKVSNTVQTPYIVKEHQSFLLRPLKNVDMQLQHNKVKNLEIAISKINGAVIKPGEYFSIWKLVGRPTRAKGYLDGLVLHNGEIGKGIGGGLCQLGNLLYWMVLHTPLEIKERWRHSYDVFPDINRKIPFGCGATLSYNYIDLMLVNNTDQTFKIHLWLDETHLNGRISSDKEWLEEYEVFETDHIMNQQWWGGYTRHNKIWQRITHRITGETHQQLVTENHAIMMYSPLLGE